MKVQFLQKYATDVQKVDPKWLKVFALIRKLYPVWVRSFLAYGDSQDFIINSFLQRLDDKH
jgi:hypothetical protein